MPYYPNNGAVVQIVSTNFSAMATGTVIIPTDDTIPQNTEGTEFMTQVITPKASTNRLVIEVNILLSNNSAAADITAALFQDSGVNALAAAQQTMPTSTYIQNLSFRHDMAAGTTSAITFRVRAGGSSAGTTTFNGQGGVRRFGGITISNIKVTEYKP
jgi:Holliday junction resolvasome RuvABC endonuclease subunit